MREWPYEKLPEINYKKEFFDDKIKDGFEVIEWIPRRSFNCIIESPGAVEINGTGSITTHSLDLYDFTDKEQEEPVLITKNYLLCNISSGYLYYSIHNKSDEGYESTYFSVSEDINDLGMPCWIIEIYTKSLDCDGIMETEEKYISMGGYGKDPNDALSEYVKKYGLDENIKVKKSRYMVEKYNSPMTLIDGNRRDLEAEKAGY